MSIAGRRCDPHTIYLHRDAEGNVLYVGCTVDLKGRTATHMRQALWRDRIATIEVESIQPDFGRGRVREWQLIQQYEPPYNRQGNPAGARENEAYQRRFVDVPLTRRRTDEELTAMIEAIAVLKIESAA